MGVKTPILSYFLLFEAGLIASVASFATLGRSGCTVISHCLKMLMQSIEKHMMITLMNNKSKTALCALFLLAGPLIHPISAVTIPPFSPAIIAGLATAGLGYWEYQKQDKNSKHIRSSVSFEEYLRSIGRNYPLTVAAAITTVSMVVIEGIFRHELAASNKTLPLPLPRQKPVPPTREITRDPDLDAVLQKTAAPAQCAAVKDRVQDEVNRYFTHVFGKGTRLDKVDDVLWSDAQYVPYTVAKRLTQMCARESLQAAAKQVIEKYRCARGLDTIDSKKLTTMLQLEQTSFDFIKQRLDIAEQAMKRGNVPPMPLPRHNHVDTSTESADVDNKNIDKNVHKKKPTKAVAEGIAEKTTDACINKEVLQKIIDQTATPEEKAAGVTAVSAAACAYLRKEFDILPTTNLGALSAAKKEKIKGILTKKKNLIGICFELACTAGDVKGAMSMIQKAKKSELYKPVTDAIRLELTAIKQAVGAV